MTATEALASIVKEGLSGGHSNRDVCAVAVIRFRNAGAKGPEPNLHSSRERGVNVMMISQGSSEVNISFVVKQVDGQSRSGSSMMSSGCRRRIMPESFSYRDAGVDIDQEAGGIRALIAALTYRRKAHSP